MQDTIHPAPPQKRGIMQTEQAVTMEEYFHRLCCGKLEGKEVDVGTVIAPNK